MDMATKNQTYSKSTGRPKPMTAKAGVTRDRNRRYGCGGKIKNITIDFNQKQL